MTTEASFMQAYNAYRQGVAARRVRVTRGALAGQAGEIVRVSHYGAVLQLDGRADTVQFVPAADLEPVGEKAI